MASKGCLTIYTTLHTNSTHWPSPPQHHLPNCVPPPCQGCSVTAKQTLVSPSSPAICVIDITISYRRRPFNARHHETDALKKTVGSGYHVRKTATMYVLARQQELCLRGPVAGDKQRKHVGSKPQDCAGTVIWQSHEPANDSALRDMRDL